VISPIDLTQYVASEPLLVVDAQFLRFDDPARWQTQEAWLASLAAIKQGIQATILPLELLAPGWNHQDLYGLQLLSHLRWSATAGHRTLPVMALAWQPLIEILRKQLEPLLISPAIEFCRLPEGLDRIRTFTGEVANGRISCTSVAAIEAHSQRSNGLASRVSHHDLANDYYAADRLWKGYKALLGQSRAQGVDAANPEIDRISSVHYEWESALNAKLNSPLIKQFQAFRSGANIPKYPIVNQIKEILEHHLTIGLPAETRVLFVDDEFDKGTAEILLQILFRRSTFTFKLSDEWVYSEESEAGQNLRWARFVCVKSVPLALNWLVHWEEIPESCVASQEEWKAWLRRWRQELTGVWEETAGTLNSQDILGENLKFVIDCKRASPRSPYSVIMLDLRLKPVTETLYSVQEFPSVRFRTTIKNEKPEIPVIIFTASRQIMNSAELLDSTSEIDGWLVKEGPDIPVDPENANSASAAAYLLERIHLYSTLASWYRESFGWDTKRKLACAELYNSAHCDYFLNEVSQTAQEIFDEIQHGKATCAPGDTFLAFVQSRVSAHPFPVSQTLVARRIALGALLLCATINSGSLEWDTEAAEALDSLLPGRSTKKFVKAVYDKLNFNQVLWMRSANILSQVLREEFIWLERQEWPQERRDLVLRSLRREKNLLGF
jgi:hypothetical protein